MSLSWSLSIHLVNAQQGGGWVGKSAMGAHKVPNRRNLTGNA